MADTQTTERLWTAEEFAQRPTYRREELIDGRIVEMSPPGWRHGKIASRLYKHLATHVDQHGLGDTVFESGYLITRAPDKIRAPDVSFVAAGRVSDPMTEGFLELAPDLAVEVVSPNDVYSRIATGVAEYLAAGTREVWVVDPDRQLIEVHRAGARPEFVTSEMSLETPLLPGLSIPVVELFA